MNHRDDGLDELGHRADVPLIDSDVLIERAVEYVDCYSIGPNDGTQRGVVIPATVLLVLAESAAYQGGTDRILRALQALGPQ